MKTRRNRHIIRNYDDQGKRPSHLLLKTVESVIADSESVLKDHTYWYADAIKQFELLKTAYAEVEKLNYAAELSRPTHVQNHKLSARNNELRAQEHQITQTMSDIRSGKTLREWQGEESSVGRALSAAHKSQRDITARQEKEANDIFRKLNLTKLENKALLSSAENRLEELERNVDSTGCCVSDKKQRLLQEQIERQGMVVNELDTQVKHAALRVMEEATRKPIVKSGNSYEIDELQKRYDRAREMVKLCRDHQDQLLSEKQKDLLSVKLARRKVIHSINLGAQRHYTDINAQVMHGLLRVYDKFNSYMTWFDLAVNKYSKHVNSKGEVADYSRSLTANKARLDTFMRRLRCHDLQHHSAKAIYNHVMQLPKKERDNLLSQKPDANVLRQAMGARVQSEAASVRQTTVTTKSSTTGFFRRTVHPATEAKRAYLKKEVRFKM